MKYTKEAALRLVQNMETYEERVTFLTQNFCNNAINSSKWEDGKYKDFCSKLSSVVLDIRSSAYTIRDYKNHLSQKIKELG